MSRSRRRPYRPAMTTTDAFAGRLFEMFTGAMLTYLIDIGRRVDLFAAVAVEPGSGAEIADRAGLDERHVREWLGAMATGGIVEFDASTGHYRLPADHAVCLTGSGVDNMTPVAYLTTVLGRQVPAVTDAFRTGKGVPYAQFLPELHDVMDVLWGPMYDELLVAAILPLAPGLIERLRAGAHAADVACGTGNGLLVLADAFPASTFVGYDHDDAAIARARAGAATRGLRNVCFEVADAAGLQSEQLFDAVFVFNALHDQADPAAVLTKIRAMLRPGGVFLMDEPRVSSNLEDNIGNPLAPFTYAVSSLHCMTVSLAEGGAGLGTAWGEQLALRMLADAGFGAATVHDAPGDPGNAVFVTTRPETYDHADPLTARVGASRRTAAKAKHPVGSTTIFRVTREHRIASTNSASVAVWMSSTSRRMISKVSRPRCWVWAPSAMVCGVSMCTIDPARSDCCRRRRPRVRRRRAGTRRQALAWPTQRRRAARRRPGRRTGHRANRVCSISSFVAVPWPAMMSGWS